MPDPVEAFFDAQAPGYAAAFATNALAAWARAQARRIYDQYLPASGTVADLGCGPGGDAVYLAQRGLQVTAVDLSTEMLRHARATAIAAGVEARLHFEVADLRQGNALRSALSGRVNGALLGFGVLNALPDLYGALCNVDPCVVPGAPVVISALNRRALWDAAWCLARGQAPARWGDQPKQATAGPGSLAAYYWSAKDLLQAVEAVGWRATGLIGVGVSAPPPYLDRSVPEALRRVLCWADPVLGRTPLGRMADMLWLCATTSE